MIRSSQPTSGSRSELMIELAAAAARLIAEDGCDYASAKRKAAQLILGESSGMRRLLPDNELVESELRRYLRTFGGEGHAALLRELRGIALALMEFLAPFNPHLVGAVLNGTATEHSDLHLQLFTDSAKDLEIFLINEGLRFAVEQAREPADALETIHLKLPRRLLAERTAPLAAELSVLPTDAIRVASRFRSTDPTLSATEGSGRAGIAALRALLALPAGAGA
jgi:hypothetical protein